MFTGLVEERGSLGRIAREGSGARLSVRSRLGQAEPFVLGESIAVDGVCLTVVASSELGFEADASAETLERTTLGALREGAPVNLERAMKLGGRMGGHLVTGHVDGVGALVSREPDSGSVKMTFRMPRAVASFVAEKGSIAVSGISLTVNAVTADSFAVTIIPHTLDATSLGTLAVGAPVNLEVDLVARYVARLKEMPPVGGLGGSIAPIDQARSNDAQWIDRLTRAGYV